MAFSLAFILIFLVLVGADWNNPCSSEPVASLPFCNISLTFEERAYDLTYNQIPKLTDYLFAYEGLTGSDSLGIKALNIPPYQWWSEALHGIAVSPGVDYYRHDATIHSTTMFPQIITTSSSFNATLFHQIGTAIITEGRAMNNHHQAGLTYWAPNINIFRDPRWGRGQETPGEDPFLTSVYATNFVRGMQGNDDKYLKVSSCCKHFADYSMEDSDGYNRHTFNAHVSEYDQNDTYLVAFKYCVVAANVSSIMCSYNEVNGIPSCSNKDLITNTLRNTYGFDGYLVSDCGAVSNVQNTHHYTNTTADTIASVFAAGMDIDCGVYTQVHTVDAIKSNSNLLPAIQEAIYHAFLVQMRLGMFDDKSLNPWNNLSASDVCSNATLTLSHEAAKQGIVLVKNSINALPIDISKIKTVALIGPNAKSKDVMTGNYRGIPPFIYDVYSGFEKYMDTENIFYVKGCDINSNSTDGIAAAVNISSTADLTVLVMGLDQSQEGEQLDRNNIALPGQQHTLIQRVGNNAKCTVILVILSGGPVDIYGERDSLYVDAILIGGYPGMYGGLAIADVIFGAFNPTARLSQTWYYNNYTEQIKMSDMNMRGAVGRGYRYFNGSVVYPFGAGMSFTKFSCGELKVYDNVLDVEVTNVGQMSGGAVVLVYFVPNNAGQSGVELKRLIGFGRIDLLQPKETELVSMRMYAEFYSSKEHQDMNGKYVLNGVCGT